MNFASDTRRYMVVPRVLRDYNWEAIQSKREELEVLIQKVHQVAVAVSLEATSEGSTADILTTDSDLDSDTDLSDSDDTFEEVLADFDAYVEGLSDLSIALDDPATDIIINENDDHHSIDALLGVDESALPFVLAVMDRFPSLEVDLVRRLGEANWQRRRRLQDKLAIAVEQAGDQISDDDSNPDGTIVWSGGRLH